MARPKRASSPAKRDAVLKLGTAEVGRWHELMCGWAGMPGEETHLHKKVPPLNFGQRVPWHSCNAYLLSASMAKRCHVAPEFRTVCG